MIEELIQSTVILEALAASEKEAALEEMLQALVASGRVAKGDAAKIRRRLREREALGSTGIGNGVAVPHVKTDKVEKVAMALARSPEGIEYQAIDGRSVQTLFLIVAPSDQAEAHLEALRWISTLARNADFRRFVLSAVSADEIRDLLREMSGQA
jgi:mannitol/fructose-specific phosphotransferase system IIA component (Ntr-type)